MTREHTSGSTAGTEHGAEDAFELRFLGVGGPGADLGPVAVVERNGAPFLMIDCPPGALDAYRRQYGADPESLYLTHTHLDHVGGMEELFHGTIVAAQADAERRIRLFAAAAIVPSLQARLVCNRFIRAEGAVNFWDAFQLTPLSEGFWLGGYWFGIFESRHMQPGFCFGLQLPGAFVYTGDTRPIPEVLTAVAATGERIFHDCGVEANPAHTGIDDLLREYPPALRSRVVCYHYGSEANARVFERRGLAVARSDVSIPVPAPAA